MVEMQMDLLSNCILDLAMSSMVVVLGIILMTDGICITPFSLLL